jgi:hypothetical protein
MSPVLTIQNNQNLFVYDIFSFLEFEQLNEVRLVNRKWNNFAKIRIISVCCERITNLINKLLQQISSVTYPVVCRGLLYLRDYVKTVKEPHLFSRLKDPLVEILSHIFYKDFKDLKLDKKDDPDCFGKKFKILKLAAISAEFNQTDSIFDAGHKYLIPMNLASCTVKMAGFDVKRAIGKAMTIESKHHRKNAFASISRKISKVPEKARAIFDAIYNNLKEYNIYQ